MLFLRTTSTIHIEVLFRRAPVKSLWTDLSLVWFAGATSDQRFWVFWFQIMALNSSNFLCAPVPLLQYWGVAKGSSVSWVAKFKGDKNSECKLSNGWSRSYKVIKLLLSAGKWVVAKLQGDKSASQSSMELYYPWISGPLRVSWNTRVLCTWLQESVNRGFQTVVRDSWRSRG